MAYGGVNINKWPPPQILGRNPEISKHQIQPEYADGQADAGRDCRTRLCETKFSGANNADREILIFPVQLTTIRSGLIGNLTRLIHTLALCVTIQTYLVHIYACIIQYTFLLILYH